MLYSFFAFCKEADVNPKAWILDSLNKDWKSVSVCLSTYFLIKKVFFALRQKDETGLHRKG
jgi:hypothetical protein